MEFGEGEKRGLAQLVICLVIFLTVFWGRGIFPVETQALREKLLDIIHQDTDFEAAFTHLGQAMAEEAPILETINEMWAESMEGGEAVPVWVNQETSMELKKEGRKDQVLLKPWTHIPPRLPPSDPLPPQTPAQRDLGLPETMTPVMGVLSSPFGERTHPITGQLKRHNGIDLAVGAGTEILAFADGVVDFVGEEPNGYGRYIQLDHGNGIKSFYAHCSELCAQKGQQVKKGDVVAKVGNTGSSTNPHLHFEIKKNDQVIDPLPYVEYTLP